ncbi:MULTISPECIES: hypothetical protein [Streptomyces]|uniref:hypothetical protein n=1 Tax=Streptomyces TaxID=1883 RepID=UPI0004AAD46E|nr:MULTISPECIES: hypothetical protein [Streptomyces]
MAPRTPRRIHVDGRDYRWIIRPRDASHVVVRAWLDTGGRSGRPLEVARCFDDPWLNHGILLTAPADRIAEVFQLAPVTPALTAALIRAGLAAGWHPEVPGAPQRFTMDGEPADFTLLPEE